MRSPPVTQCCTLARPREHCPPRLRAYVAPHLTQRTNVRNNLSLRELLQAGRQVDILGWIDPGLQRIGAFDLNMAAGLEDSIISVLAPPWNGSRASPPSSAAVQDAAAAVMAAGVPAQAVPVAELLPPGRVIAQPDRASVVVGGPSEQARVRFAVRLGKTYYHQGFFNVPVAFSHHFAEHGAAVKLYCGSERALMIGALDRRANTNSKTPRIYGKAELAHWMQRRLTLDGLLEVTVVGPTELLLN